MDYRIMREQVKILNKAHNRMYEDIREKYNLSLNEILLMIYLYHNPEENTAKEITNKIKCTKSHISKSVESLYSRGFLEKVIDKEDKKMVHLILTEESKEPVKEINDRVEYVRNNALNDIPIQDLEITKKTFKKIVENIEEMSKMFE